MCQIQFILEDEVCRVGSEMYRVWKLYEINLVIQTCQNNFSFSLYAVLSVCYVITTLDKQMKSEVGLSADFMYCH